MPTPTGAALRLAGPLLCMILGGSATLRAQEVSAELACLERAQDQTLLAEEERRRLCLGTRSLEPIACLREALEEPPLDTPEAVDLCRCATSTEPVRCFRKALELRPNKPLWAVRQCSPISVGNLTADCRPVVPTESGLR